MTIDIVKEEQLCSLGAEAEVLLKTPASADRGDKIMESPSNLYFMSNWCGI